VTDVPTTVEANARLALRHEGDFWNGYFARRDTMQGAVLLGSIRMSALARNPARKDEFVALMRGLMEDVVTECGDEIAHWNEPEAAPESERSGHA
jgi:hypothetical protein